MSGVPPLADVVLSDVNNLRTDIATSGNNMLVSNGSQGSFVPLALNPVWSAISCNCSVAPNTFSGVSTNNDVAGFWTDPFGIVHLRGLICANTSTGVNVANTKGNVTFANIAGFAVNIANGLPFPTAQVVIDVSCANVSGTGQVGNVSGATLVLQTNGALQCFNVSPQAFSSNLANLSLYGFSYSTI